jgi:prepilin-type N-terminal cleavage/methylation domain-containing protein
VVVVLTMNSRKLDKSIKIKHLTINQTAGFTLAEVLVSIVILGIISALISYTLGFMISSNQKLAKEQNRRTEISRALEAITNDIRMARNINKIAPNPITQIASAAVSDSNTAAAFSPTLNLGTPVLYLEIPLGICAATSINIVDRVIYDIRPKLSTDPWLGPQLIYRYGRTANEDGAVDPCSNPVSNIAIVDGIVSHSTPSCTAPAILSGVTDTSANTGFYACVNNDRVAISIFGELSGDNVYEASENVTTRLTN